ncbi:FGGY-family carbohydrate kinase [Blastopirellula sp. JC732]|uniref:FGGY-family carbohydrate kinase n=1 Tax=Blastopirellula sediminis TaxID=2894196 RepID=A0A9X1SFG4_9BACT|nr:FGGY-family carbohydrate kinase [Blastopirellula sediminis]MCC9608950.1 FGGY-family carbohydrate kinase [Blastopirellula sediminis]MCC9628273.1 FGGY-family carbohydrate kinase [Blastopirellula sediminis]
MNDRYYIGVDVGTGSARAGLFDSHGTLKGSATQAIATYRPQANFVQQSSTNIWQSVCQCVRQAIAAANVDPAKIRGIGFDATCSLVVTDAEGRPVTVSPDGDDDQNVIVWMDHRATDQAARINGGGHEVLKYVGNVISPEMETPKLLWLKENLPASWRRGQKFFDLPDYLTYRATGDETRSLCSTVCKWTYLGHEEVDGADQPGRWDAYYFRAIGLEDLADENFARIGRRVRAMGESISPGVTPSAAAELGVPAGTAVGVSIIDAHAGGIGMIGACLENEEVNLDRRLALIGGTSSCHMAVSQEPRYIQGIWGPYYSAMVPGMWLTEGGQSATGALVDFVVENHGASAQLRQLSTETGKSVYEILNERLTALSTDRKVPASLTRELHVSPYFHGNRSPWADPTLRGMISGLTMSASLDDLARLYLAVIQAIAYGTRHIIEVMNRAGYRIDTIFACGGGVKNPIFLREHADITQCRIVLPQESESVLLGSAMLGAVASGDHSNLLSAMAAMSGVSRVLEPTSGPTAAYHQAKYEVFQRMHDDQLAYRELMKPDIS